MLAGFIHIRVRVNVMTIVSGIKKLYATTLKLLLLPFNADHNFKTYTRRFLCLVVSSDAVVTCTDEASPGQEDSFPSRAQTLGDSV